jgi:hypothetical protein
VIGANVIATLVANHPIYSYRIQKADNQICEIEWQENKISVGISSFTIEEAKTAGLTGKDNWKKYPSDMLFARAISRGAKRFAPGIFGGAPVYTPDELGMDVDHEGYTVIEGVTKETEQPKPSPNTSGPDWNLPDPVEAESDIDWRKKLTQSNGKTTLGLVADCAANACPYYDHSNHAYNAMADYELLAGKEFSRSRVVSNDGALALYDWLLERASEKADKGDG